jgi:hypothetical protein
MMFGFRSTQKAQKAQKYLPPTTGLGAVSSPPRNAFEIAEKRCPDLEQKGVREKAQKAQM